MYIEDKYWGNYIGGTDDSLTLVEHLSEKQKKEITLGEIFSDFGLDKIQGDFRKDVPLMFVDAEGYETEIYYAIDIITDLAALLLECKVNGSVNLCELFGDDLENAVVPDICITATPEEHKKMNEVLMDFASEPLSYDLSEMVPEEDMLEMAAICEELRKELYGDD